MASVPVCRLVAGGRCCAEGVRRGESALAPEAARQRWCFPRRYRLARSLEIRNLLRARDAKRKTDRYFRTIFRENPLGHPRLCLAVPRRYVRLAVHRNRIKRIIRESFRHIPDQLGSLDIMILVRHPLHQLTPDALRLSLSQLFEGIHRSLSKQQTTK